MGWLLMFDAAPVVAVAVHSWSDALVMAMTAAPKLPAPLQLRCHCRRRCFGGVLAALTSVSTPPRSSFNVIFAILLTNLTS